MGAKRGDTGKDVRVGMLLEEAENFIERGVDGLGEGVKTNGDIKILDAAEELWNAVVSATKALILYYLDVVSASRCERRKLLEKLEDMDPSVEKLKLRSRYEVRERCLHVMALYGGITDLDMLRGEVDKVKNYVSDVKNLVARSDDQN